MSEGVKKEYTCSKHGVYEAEALFYNGQEIKPNCPECQKEFQAEREKDAIEKHKQQIANREKREFEDKFRDAMIPPRFLSKNFDNYKISEGNLDQAGARNIALMYATNFPDMQAKGRCMIFVGKPGTGKTHLACAIANYVISNFNKTVLFTKIYKIIRNIKETYGNPNKNESEVIKSYVGLDLLILDEVGIQNFSPTELNYIFEIINERYEQVKPTIFITNGSKEEIINSLGSRVLDRIGEDGCKVKFMWSSYRS